MSTNPRQSLLIRALNREAVERTPLWIMRQAGRYLPEYRALREQAGSFMALCKNPSLACEATLQPLRRFELDAAILFSDILTIPDAMGLGLSFQEGEGPKFKKTTRTERDLEALKKLEVKKDLAYVFEAVCLIRKEMPAELPLIGFAGSPWTLACYMVEGRSSRDYQNILQMLWLEPTILHQLLTILAEAVTHYLLLQIEAGANVLMIFDSWGGILPYAQYREFSLHYLALIVETIKKQEPEYPIILFTKGGGQWLTEIADTGCDAIGVDWTTDLAKARRKVGHLVALQGNLHPSVLLSNPETIKKNVHLILEAYGNGSGHIFNLGHGITPEVPPEHVKVLVDAVRELSREYH